MRTGFWIGVLILVLSLLSAVQAKQTSLTHQPFQWEQVAIGGGGYMTGIAIHPQNPDLIYVRTDVGGVYRWDNQTEQLIQLMAWVGPEASNLYGINGIALDPTDQQLVYIAAGKYMQDWAGEYHEVFRSEDQGATWQALDVPGRFAANNGNQRFGKPLQVNPHNPDQLWVGTKNAGAWIYTNSTQAWSQVTSISTTAAVQTISFDQQQANSVYVGLRDGGVYRSANASTFELIPNSPQGITDLDLAADGATLYASTTAQGVWRLDAPQTGTTWTQITPPSGSEWRTITANPHDANSVITWYRSFGGIDAAYLSADRGTTWQALNGSVAEQIVPWHPDVYPGSAVSQIAWDPVDPKRVYFTDWYSFWQTDDITAEDVQWNNRRSRGHEELVVLSLATVPSNERPVQLYSGHADVSGLAHTQLQAYPNTTFGDSLSETDSYFIKETTAIGVTPAQPNMVVAIGAGEHGGDPGGMAISYDFGQTFSHTLAYSESWGWGRVAVSSTDPNKLIVATKNNGIQWSADGGQSFSAATGAPSSGAMRIDTWIWNWRFPLVADPVVGDTFYVYAESQHLLYRSTDGGQNWAATSAVLPGSYNEQLGLHTAPGRSGELWLNLGTDGLWYSSDAGATFTQFSNVADALLFAVGAPAPDSQNPTLYLYGALANETEQWIYQSTDGGASWQRINTSDYRIGNSPQVMWADQYVYGHVYIGTNGTGIWMGSIPQNHVWLPMLTR